MTNFTRDITDIFDVPANTVKNSNFPRIIVGCK